MEVEATHKHGRHYSLISCRLRTWIHRHSKWAMTYAMNMVSCIGQSRSELSYFVRAIATLTLSRASEHCSGEVLSQHVAVPNLVILHVLERLPSIVHRHLLNPRFNPFGPRELKHFETLLLIADVAPAHETAIRSEVEGMDLGKCVVAVRESN